MMRVFDHSKSSHSEAELRSHRHIESFDFVLHTGKVDWLEIPASMIPDGWSNDWDPLSTFEWCGRCGDTAWRFREVYQVRGKPIMLLRTSAGSEVFIVAGRFFIFNEGSDEPFCLLEDVGSMGEFLSLVDPWQCSAIEVTPLDRDADWRWDIAEYTCVDSDKAAKRDWRGYEDKEPLDGRIPFHITLSELIAKKRERLLLEGGDTICAMEKI